jgi:predicted amidohydrolase YtcJ
MREAILLRHARVLSCTGDEAERPFDGDVLIEGERIAAVSRGRLAVDPGGCRVIDLGGATVLPGLGDAHTHISWPLDFVFDHLAVANAPADRHALDVAAVTRTYVDHRRRGHPAAGRPARQGRDRPWRHRGAAHRAKRADGHGARLPGS